MWVGQILKFILGVDPIENFVLEQLFATTKFSVTAHKTNNIFKKGILIGASLSKPHTSGSFRAINHVQTNTEIRD